MKQIINDIERLIQQDPGGRGLSEWAVTGELGPAVNSIADGGHILIATGFYIPSAGEIETDGPPGAIILADTLIKSGKEVTLIVDQHSEAILKKGIEAVGTAIPYVAVPVDGDFDPATLIKKTTTHFIALERPGRTSDGHFYTFRGFNISAYHMELDPFFTDCRKNGIITIGIGDGGNELGMGRVASDVDKYIPFDRPFSCRTEADYTLCAGVSNWAGYGIASLLSIIGKRNLMAPTEQLYEILHGIVDAGAVDGVTGRQEPTVDGLDAGWEYGIYRELYMMASGASEAA